MSLITRCPDCGTMFKVVPDQLRISEGWVRCGQCSHVFDASAHMQAAVASEPESVETLPATLVEAPGPAAPVAAVPEREDFGPSTSEIDEGLPSEVLDSALIAAEAQALREHPLDQPFELRRQDAADEDQAGSSQSPQTQPDSEIQDLAFVRKARRQTFGRRPRVRGMMRAAVVALGALLLLQVVLQDRDRLAAAEPALRPWLAGLCAALNCRIGPHRKIDAIAIESSSFNKLRANGYRLQVTLRNLGGVELALPALELTLTDGQDQAVIRRVLMPAELGAKANVIAPAAEWSSSVSVAVADEGLGNRIAGYRLLAFYP
jgi:predicted Zn finger-like uncharacterized protein